MEVEIEKYREDMDEEYELLYSVAKKYPKLFKLENWSRKLFDKAFTTVVTRCFGWSMPSTMIVPFADNMNHHVIDS